MDITAQAPNSDVAFPETGWAQASLGEDPQTRLFAALNLARVRKQAGLETGDDLVVGQRIVESSMPLAQITHEASVISSVLASQGSSKVSEAPRNLVPRRVQQRTMPSVASAGVTDADDGSFLFS